MTFHVQISKKKGKTFLALTCMYNRWCQLDNCTNLNWQVVESVRDHKGVGSPYMGVGGSKKPKNTLS